MRACSSRSHVCRGCFPRWDATASRSISSISLCCSGCCGWSRAADPAMRRFTELYLALDASTKTHAKTAALVEYFASAPPHDAAWATFFLTGRKLKRVVGTRDLVAAARDASAVPEWLFESSY